MIAKIINFDLAKLERRILARYSKRTTVDLHVQRASELFNVLPQDVTIEMRTFAKRWYYAENYSYKSLTGRFFNDR